MADNEKAKMPSHLKVAWAIYTVLVVIVIAILVLFVAQDNEERLFYALMPAAAAYVFRPTDKFMRKLTARFGAPDNSADDQ